MPLEKSVTYSLHQLLDRVVNHWVFVFFYLNAFLYFFFAGWNFCSLNNELPHSLMDLIISNTLSLFSDWNTTMDIHIIYIYKGVRIQIIWHKSLITTEKNQRQKYVHCWSPVDCPPASLVSDPPSHQRYIYHHPLPEQVLHNHLSYTPEKKVLTIITILTNMHMYISINTYRYVFKTKPKMFQQ